MLVDLTEDAMADLLTTLVGTTALLDSRWDDMPDPVRRELIGLAAGRVKDLVAAAEVHLVASTLRRSGA